MGLYCRSQRVICAKEGKNLTVEVTIDITILWIKTQRVKSRNNSCIGVTQENSIEFLRQSSLPYILLPMVHASYCASYPKWLWV